MSPEFDRRAFRDLSYGLYIVTSLDGVRLNGQIVNTVIQVTSDPARVAVIVNKQNLTHEFISKSGLFGPDPRIYFEEWAVWGIRTG